MRARLRPRRDIGPWGPERRPHRTGLRGELPPVNPRLRAPGHLAGCAENLVSCIP